MAATTSTSMWDKLFGCGFCGRWGAVDTHGRPAGVVSGVLVGGPRTPFLLHAAGGLVSGKNSSSRVLLLKTLEPELILAVS